MLRVGAAAFYLAGALSVAQVPIKDRPAFAVISIRSNKSDTGVPSMMFSGNGARFVARDVTAKALILSAYQIDNLQLSGGPAWLSSEDFDIDAQSDQDVVPLDRRWLMVRSLLEDRFQLRIHRESRRTSYYVLVAAKNGPKMKLSADPTSREGSPQGAITFGAGSATGNAIALPVLARYLSAVLRRTVIDKTGLEGFFDIQLRWTPDPLDNPAAAPGAPHAATPAGAPPADGSLFTALEEQLGLRLQAAQGPMDILIVDRIDKPSEN